jgi:ribose transport system permease protein
MARMSKPKDGFYAQVVAMSNQTAQQINQKPLGLALNRFLAPGAFVILFAFFAIFAHNFFTVRGVLNLLVQTSTFVILSIGATLVLIVGGIDFSLGAEIAFSGTAVVVFAMMGIPIWISMILAICMGGMIGLANGFLVARVHLQSFIVTIGMSFLIFGFLGSLGSLLPPPPPSMVLPESFGDLANKTVFTIITRDATGVPIVVFPGISWIVIIMVFIVILFQLILTKTRIGRTMYLVGSNQAASRFSGIKVVRVRIIAFVLGGMLAGLAGVLLASRMMGSPGGAAGYEYIGIACAMIGGASLSGGAGRVWGTVIGAFILSTLSMGLTMMNTNSPSIFTLLDGFVILGAVYLERIRNRYNE